MNNKEKAGIIFKTAISLIVITLIIYFIGYEKIIHAIGKTGIWQFILAGIFFVISTIITAFAVIPLTKTSFYQTFKFKAVSWSTGMFLPSKIGEMSFAFLLKNNGISPKKSIGIFFIDRFVSFSIICFFGLIGIIKYFNIEINLTYLIITAAAIIGLFILRNKIRNIQIVKKNAVLIYKTKNYIKNEKKAVAINYFFSLMNFAILFWLIQFLFISLGQKAELTDVALISSISLLVAIIPISINGLGLKEGIQIYLYSLIGILPEYSALVAFIFLVSSYAAAGMFLALFYNEFGFLLKRKAENA